jgi:hypothetical protein
MNTKNIGTIKWSILLLTMPFTISNQPTTHPFIQSFTNTIVPGPTPIGRADKGHPTGIWHADAYPQAPSILGIFAKKG